MPTISQFLSSFSFNGMPVTGGGGFDPTAGTRAQGQATLDRAFLERQRDELKKQYLSLQGRSLFGSGPNATAAKQQLSELQAQLDEIDQRLSGVPLGSTNPVLTKYGLTDADFQYNIAPIYAKLLQSAEQGGGYLSPTQSSREFASATAGIGSSLDAADRGAQAAASQANLNPIFAANQAATRRFDAMNQVFGKRAEIGAEGESRKFQAEKAFSDMLAGLTVSQQQERTQTIAALTGNERALKEQHSAANKAFWGNVIGGVAGAGLALA